MSAVSSVSAVSGERSGYGWSWFGVVFGAVLSVAGNAWHVVLTPAAMDMTLRLVWAVIWPVLLLIGIEVLVRVAWRNGWRFWMDWGARFMLTVPVAIVSAVVSYRHQSALILLADPSDPFSAAIGPLAIDGLMLGCTVALLVLRSLEQTSERTSAPAVDNAVDSEQPVSAPAPNAPAVDDAVSSEQISQRVVSEDWQLMHDQPVSTGCPFDEQTDAPAPDPDAPEVSDALTEELAELVRQESERTAQLERERERLETLERERERLETLEREQRERSGSTGALETALAMLLAGKSVAAVVTASEGTVGESTLRRYARVLRLLTQHGAGRPIDCRKERVRADLVEIIREHVRSERERGQGGER